MNWLQKISQQIPSKSQFEDLMARVFNRNRECFKEEDIQTWRQWLNSHSPYNISLSLEGDYDIYDRYLRDLPEDVAAIDLIGMYQRGELLDIPVPVYQFQPTEISSTNVESIFPWQPQTKPRQLPTEEAMNIYEIAKQRRSKSNAPQIDEARKQIFLAFNTDSTIAERVGVKPAKLRAFAGLTAKQKNTEEMLNQNIPDEHQWVGITNSTFIGRQNIKPEDLDQFVKSIDVTEQGRGYWGDQGESLRRYISSVFMAIDTRISYDDLSFSIGNFERKQTRGNYSPREKLIKVADINPNTIAHEIGHYLDYKWSEQYFGTRQEDGITIVVSLGTLNPLSEIMEHRIQTIPEEHREWVMKFRDFVHNNLMNKSDIWSEYTQQAREVFARFVDRFTQWTTGRHRYEYGMNRRDAFSESDFRIWVRLLQEKSYIDTKYPLSINNEY